MSNKKDKTIPNEKSLSMLKLVSINQEENHIIQIIKETFKKLAVTIDMFSLVNYITPI